jgi:signal transduction histidine kinase/CheY-like chemotaxis protein
MHLMKKSIVLLFYIFFSDFTLINVFPQNTQSTLWSDLRTKTSHQYRIDSPWLISNFLTDSDLYYKNIFDIAYDKDKNIWVATSEGLYQYDGYQWFRYTELNGLPSRFIRCVMVTHDNILWIGTDRGAGTFDGNKFETNLSDINLVGSSVRRIIEDKNHTLWFCCDPWPTPEQPGGLTYRTPSGQWNSYTTQNGLPSKNVIDFYHDSYGRLFALTTNGLAQLNYGRWVNPLENQGFDNIDSRMWDITESKSQGVIVTADDSLFVLHEQKWKQYPLYQSKYDQVSSNKYLYTTKDDRTLFLVCPEQNTRQFMEWQNGNYIPISSKITTHPGGIEGIGEFKDGSIWAVGFNCLLRWNKKTPSWKQYDSLGSPKFIDNENAIWFHNTQNNQTIIKEKTNWYTIQQPMNDVILDASQSIFGWDRKKIFHFKEETLDSFRINDHIEGEIYKVVPGPKKGIWIITEKTPNNYEFAHFDGVVWKKPLTPTLDNCQILAIQPDILFGIYLYVHNLTSDTYEILHFFSEYQITPIPVLGYTDQNAMQMKIGPDKNIWMFGIEGLYYFHIPKYDGESWLKFPGIPNSNIKTLTFREKEIWCGLENNLTNSNSISRLNRNRSEWIHYKNRNVDYSYLGNSQTLYFGGKGNLFLVPEQWNNPPIEFDFPIQYSIHSILEDKNQQLWIQAGDSVYNYTPSIHPPKTDIMDENQDIAEGENYEINVRAFAYNQPNSQKNFFLYSWRIDDGEWVTPQPLPDNHLILESVSPGRHTLQVRASDIHQQVDPTPDEVVFYVHPRYIHQTDWFRIAVIITFICILCLAIYALATRRKLAHYAKNLEQIVKERTHELSLANRSLEMDIRNRKQTEEKLRKSEERFRNIINASPMGIHIYELHEEDKLILVNINPASNTITGIDMSFLIGKELEEAFPMLKDTQIPDLYRDSAKNGITHHIPNFVFKRENQPIIFDIYVFQTSSKQIATLFTDVSEQRLLEEQLRQSQKMEAVGNLAGGIAHDFNNILTGIIGYSDLLLSLLDSNDSNHAIIQEIQKAGERAAGLTRQLLAFSRKQILAPKVIQFNELILNLEDMLRRLIGENIEFNIDLDNELFYTYADPGQIDQIILNLVINAQEAMPQGGTLTIQTRNHIQESTLQYDSTELASGRYAQIIVKDTGIGMDEETQSRIFEPFFTTKEKDKGTGLGLATVYGIVKQSQGHIQIESEKGVGSTFTVWFPATNENPSEKQISRSTSTVHSGNETIMVVEDEEIVRKLVHTILQENGYNVLVATDCAEALQQSENLDDEIHLLISDVILPQMSGKELADRISLSRPSTKILYMSGYTDDAIVHHGVLDEGIEFIQKPFNPNDLLNRVRRIIDNA